MLFSNYLLYLILEFIVIWPPTLSWKAHENFSLSGSDICSLKHTSWEDFFELHAGSVSVSTFLLLDEKLEYATVIF